MNRRGYMEIDCRTQCDHEECSTMANIVLRGTRVSASGRLGWDFECTHVDFPQDDGWTHDMFGNLFCPEHPYVLPGGKKAEAK